MADASLLWHLRGYVGFDAESAQTLQSLGPTLRPHFTRIVEEFYDAILGDPVAKAVLRDEAQIERLRVSLHEWLDRLVTGPYDEAYFEKRARIGRMHVKVGLDQRYMLGAMNLIRVGLHRAIVESAENPLGAFEKHNSIDQICDIELAIMLETYREDYILKKTAEAESLAVMGRLTAGLAHEIRNPLNAAMLQLDVLQRNAKSVGEAPIRRRIERRTNLVQDELRRLSMLLDDFLNLARARGFEPVACDASELLSEVIELRRPEIQSQGIEVVADLDGNSRALFAEPDRLKQVVNNLITNAVEAVIDCDSPAIRVTSRLLDRNRWEVAVIDNGPGITPEVAERAFESFVTTKEAGTGLGLAIVKRIVDLHGGAAQLTPASGGGTCASFWIPLRRRSR
ncbi:MAG: protoglobin domain-containing protein [Myxococcales bacterium]|nr:protoglobin domain-containing protein [Myxococcales bacterium]MDH3484398.1 protoglobin domain-containing protein [Myxococcales bacterium]